MGARPFADPRGLLRSPRRLHVEAAGYLGPMAPGPDGRQLAPLSLVRVRAQPGQVWRSIPSRSERRGRPRRLLVCAVSALGEDGRRADCYDLDSGAVASVRLVGSGRLDRYELASDPNLYRVRDLATGRVSSWADWTHTRRALGVLSARNPGHGFVTERTIPDGQPLPELGTPERAVA